MNRRDFIKTLVAVGAIAATSTPSILNAMVEKLPEIEYPDVTYSRDWILEKQTHLHSVTMRSKDTEWYIVEYSDDKYLPKWLYDDMVAKLKERHNEQKN